MIKRLECESSTRAFYKKTEKLVQLVEQSLYTRTVKCSSHLFLIVFSIFYTYKNIGGYSLKVKQLFVAQYILVQARVSSLTLACISHFFLLAFIAQQVEQYTVNILARCSNHLKGVKTIRVLELVDRTNLSFVDFNHKRSSRFSDKIIGLSKNKLYEVLHYDCRSLSEGSRPSLFCIMDIFTIFIY